jgi:hypothetical protein
MRPSLREGFVDIVAEDGVIVMSGTIDQLRENLYLNTENYGEPIVHPSATVSTRSASTIIKKGAKNNPILAEMEEEKRRHQENMEVLAVARDIELAKAKLEILCIEDDDAMEGGSDVDDESVTAHVEAPPKGFILPNNKVGALQEKYQSRGIFPLYTVVRKQGPPHDVSFTCQVNLGYLEFRATGQTNQAAKQAAAGKMLYSVIDTNPFVEPGPVLPKDTSKTGVEFIYNENYVPPGLGAQDVAGIDAPALGRWSMPDMDRALAWAPPFMNRKERRARTNAIRRATQGQISTWEREPVGYCSSDQ